MVGKSYLNKAVERGSERARNLKSRMWKVIEFAVKEQKKSKMACLMRILECREKPSEARGEESL